MLFGKERKREKTSLCVLYHLLSFRLDEMMPSFREKSSLV